MNLREAWARIAAENDQDRAACREWWGDASLEAKRLVWEEIQKEQATPEAEIMSRFAQLAFAEMAAEMEPK